MWCQKMHASGGQETILQVHGLTKLGSIACIIDHVCMLIMHVFIVSQTSPSINTNSLINFVLREAD